VACGASARFHRSHQHALCADAERWRPKSTLLPVEPLQFQGQVSERTGHSMLSLEDKSSAKPVTSADFSSTVEQRPFSRDDALPAPLIH
jgi:hypothetical protein